ncbi:MAG: T9SS type A sorting domain-containing protein [candidate division Zixibacteria bacterium]|nr:T9SS type A sorting domain-containing protein [candidate division Zixibacteria bacterium]
MDLECKAVRTDLLSGRVVLAATLLLAAIIAFFPTNGTTFAQSLTSIRVASGLSAPELVTSPSNDLDRAFIVEQTGAIRILQDGQLLPTPFLDIDSLVSYGGERGLLGLTFHPDYDQNKYFYVNYTDVDGNTVIARFEASNDPNVADPDSRANIFTIDQPYSNHNAGMLAFGPNDGYLYFGLGDGGSAGDPGNRAQDDSVLLGKMIRIDVDSDFPYAIPDDNPFVGPGPPLDEIWAKGLRNPWRFSFDRANGDMYIADVGQNLWEEVDYQPGDSPGGENYGWRLMEGSHCYNPPEDCDPGGLTYPIHEYSHGGSPYRCSITGGYVYRGDAMPSLQGTYFFADYCSGQIWSFRYDGNNVNDFQERTSELEPQGNYDIADISSFGEDGAGDIYITDLDDGEVFKIVPTISIDMVPNNPPIEIPAGGSFTYTGSLTNNTDQSIMTDVWLMLDVPGYGIYGPLRRFNGISLNPNQNISQGGFVQNVPNYAPSGTYTYTSLCGTFDTDTVSAASFEFTVTAARQGQADSWDVTDWFSDRQTDEKLNLDISGSYPNPFNAQNQISYTVPASGHVNLEIYNLVGQKVATLIDGNQEAGYHTINWDASGYASGVYFYRLSADEEIVTRRITLVK